MICTFHDGLGLDWFLLILATWIVFTVTGAICGFRIGKGRRAP